MAAHDAACVLVHYLTEEHGWTARDVATAVHVPPTCVEMALAQATSSPLLRSQLRHWLATGPGAAPTLPAPLVAAAIRQADSTEVPDDGDCAFGAVDPLTRQHFEFLRQSVGHNVASILNDPTQAAPVPSESFWGIFGSQRDAPTVGPSLRPLCVPPMALDQYVEQVGDAYRHRRAVDAGAFSGVGDAITAHAGAPMDEELTAELPDTVPSEFATPGYSVERLVRSLIATAPDPAAVISDVTPQLEEFHGAVGERLTVAVHAKSSSFIDAIHTFDSLTSEARAAASRVEQARQGLQDGGRTLLSTIARTASLYRRARRMEAVLRASTQVALVLQHLERAEAIIEGPGVVDYNRVVANVAAATDVLAEAPRMAALAGLPGRVDAVYRRLGAAVTDRAATLLDVRCDATDWADVEGILRAADGAGRLRPCLERYTASAKEAMIACVLDGVAAPGGSLADLLSRPHRDLVAAARTVVAQAAKNLGSPAAPPLLERIVADAVSQVRRVRTHLETVVQCGAWDAGGLEWVRQHLGAAAATLQALLLPLFESPFAGPPSSFRDHVRRVVKDISRIEREVAETLQAHCGPGHPVLCGQVRAAVTQRTKAYFGRFYDARFEMLLNVVSEDPWQPAPVHGIFQTCCDTLVTPLPPRVAQRGLLVSDGETPFDVADDSGEAGRGVRVTGFPHDFVVPHSTLVLLQLLRECDWFLGAFPPLAYDVVSKAHDLLRLYDGQCAGLVLGAGAVDKGTLQSVTVSHLAVGSQALDLLSVITPLLVRRLEQAATGGEDSARVQPFIGSLRRVSADVAAHRNEFLNKITSVCRARCAKPPLTPQWAADGQPWLMAQLKEIARVKKALRVVLTPRGEASVLVPVLHLVGTQLKQSFEEARGAVPHDALRSALLLFKVNVESFGYAVGAVLDQRVVDDAVAGCGANLSPETEEDVLRLYGI